MREAERKGRIRHEQELKDLRHQLAATRAIGPADAAGPSTSSTSYATPSSYPFRPLGHVRSVYSERNGTPRQPMLVTASRAILELESSIPKDCLSGLEQYSHVWLIYVFHKNTDLHRLWDEGSRPQIKAKIHVPRLNGGKMGVLATRSPHRPSPIGLSTAEIISVDVARGRVVLAATDVVDGTPILDIKPYVSFADNLAHTKAPAWVAPESSLEGGEPLKLNGLSAAPEVIEQVRETWSEGGGGAASRLHESFEVFWEFVQQVLSRDIRSVHQRQQGMAAVSGPGKAELGFYRLIVDGVDIGYDVLEDRTVLIRDSRPGE